LPSAETAPPKSVDTADLTTYIEKNLSCEIFINAKWGDGENEFGFLRKHDSNDYQISEPYPPVFNEQGDLFFFDTVNEKIFMYSKNEKTPKIIRMPNLYSPNFLPGTTPWTSNISVSNDKIFFLTKGVKESGRYIFRLLALSIKNNELTMIDLEPYYPQNITRGDAILADKNGGIYIIFDRIVIHYDEKLQSNLLVNSDLVDPIIFYKIGWDGNLYSQGVPDVVANWGNNIKSFDEQPVYVFQEVHATLTGLNDKSMHDILIGADNIGRLYFLQYYNEYGKTKDEINIIRFDVQTRTQNVGKITNKDWLSYSYELAPDGSLYGLVFNREDYSIQPKIIRCSFS